MPRFHPLEITNIRRETDAAVVLSLAPQSGDFSFEAGQYLTFRKDFDGTELRRCYSVCAAPNEELQVGIKAVDGGAFSSFANSELKVGDMLEAMPPMGNFGAKRALNNLGFAGGSGITPLPRDHGDKPRYRGQTAGKGRGESPLGNPNRAALDHRLDRP